MVKISWNIILKIIEKNVNRVMVKINSLILKY